MASASPEPVVMGVIMGSAVPVPVEIAEIISLPNAPLPGAPLSDAQELSTEKTEKTEKAAPEFGPDRLRDAVLNALSNSGHRMLVSMLDAGEWQLEGSTLQIKVAASASLIDMSLGADAKRVAIATASGVLGKPAKLNVVSGAVSGPQSATPRAASNGGGRSRAEQDPVVRRMKEKFGAEIRTIIDYREKR